jgi:hypothetical protein
MRGEGLGPRLVDCGFYMSNESPVPVTTPHVQIVPKQIKKGRKRKNIYEQGDRFRSRDARNGKSKLKEEKRKSRGAGKGGGEGARGPHCFTGASIERAGGGRRVETEGLCSPPHCEAQGSKWESRTCPFLPPSALYTVAYVNHIHVHDCIGIII